MNEELRQQQQQQQQKVQPANWRPNEKEDDQN